MAEYGRTGRIAIYKTSIAGDETADCQLCTMQVDSSALMQTTKANAGESGLDLVNKGNQVRLSLAWCAYLWHDMLLHRHKALVWHQCCPFLVALQAISAAKTHAALGDIQDMLQVHCWPPRLPCAEAVTGVCSSGKHQHDPLQPSTCSPRCHLLKM
jgi:hypothetical protein